MPSVYCANVLNLFHGFCIPTKLYIIPRTKREHRSIRVKKIMKVKLYYRRIIIRIDFLFSTIYCLKEILYYTPGIHIEDVVEVVDV